MSIDTLLLISNRHIEKAGGINHILYAVRNAITTFVESTFAEHVEVLVDEGNQYGRNILRSQVLSVVRPKTYDLDINIVDGYDKSIYSLVFGAFCSDEQFSALGACHKFNVIKGEDGYVLDFDKKSVTFPNEARRLVVHPHTRLADYIDDNDCDGDEYGLSVSFGAWGLNSEIALVISKALSELSTPHHVILDDSKGDYLTVNLD